MRTVRLGRTDLDVTPIAFGTWQLGGDWGRFDEREAVAAIRQARELGINLFDTAQAYGFGASEQLLAQALRDELDRRRDDLIIATKGGLRMTPTGVVRDSSPGWLRQGVAQSLAALGTDYIDLYQIHWPDPTTPLAETAEALQGLVDEGKIRHVGVSNFSPEQIDEFARTRPVETVQPPYHLFRREIEHDLLPYAREHDIGVLVYGPLAHGLLTGALDEATVFAADDWRGQRPEFQDGTFHRNLEKVRELAAFAEERGYTVGQLAVAWTLANPAVQVAIVGTRNAAHIEESVVALDMHLTDNDLQAIDRIMSGAVAVAVPPPGRG
jgi:aryl-alcohol dehydrogenase-like predicted oxidoreductase